MIDVHTHCLMPEHWGREWEDHWQPVYGKPYPAVTPQEYDEAMAPVSVALVFGLRATAVGVATPHTDVAAFCRETRTDTIGFMALDLADPDVLDHMREGVDLGLRGIKLYPVLGGFDASDEARHGAFYAAAEEARLPVLWHMGATPSPVGDLAVTQPLVIDQVARRHPGLVQIIAHMGHPWQTDTIVVLRKNPNVFADVSALWSRPLDGYFTLVRAQEWDVVDKLLFGSDFPLWTPADAMQSLRRLATMDVGDLPRVASETVERIIAQDALDLLSLSGTHSTG